MAKEKAYQRRFPTHDHNSSRAKHVLVLGSVELVTRRFASENILGGGFRGCDGVLGNVDDLNCGEKTEIYWVIRAYELAIEEWIKFYDYSNLGFVHKESGCDPNLRSGHYGGKR